MSISATEVFCTYLDRFTSGDVAGAAELLSEDFSFQGPMLQSSGRAAFLEGAAGLGPIVRGYEMKHQWVDGEEVCSVYDFKIQTPAGAGAIRMAEWATIREGVLTSARLIFDTAAMAALMPSES